MMSHSAPPFHSFNEPRTLPNTPASVFRLPAEIAKFPRMRRRDFNAIMLSSAATTMFGRTIAAAVKPSGGQAVQQPGSQAVQQNLRINPDRISAHLTALSEFGKNPEGGVSRVAYSDADKAGRAAVIEWMRAARLEPSVDFAGNIIGRRAGSDSSLHALLFGSHIDSVPGGGNYDGDVGSMSAIEVAQTLAEHSIVTRHPIEEIGRASCRER